MGGCISSSSNGENVSPHSCFEMSFFRRKVSRRAYSYSNTSLQHLSSIPNRIFSNGRSSGSCIFTQQGRKGINQDAMIVWEDFIAEDDVTFCGVFDGHGPYGHLVARRVRDALPLKLLSFVQSSKSKHNGSVIICCNEDPKSDVVDPEKKVSVEDQEKALWREAFLKSYKAMDKELRSYPNLDCFCSGSTAVSIVKQGSNLFMGNIGDSRAILASKDESDSLVANQLTVDLKPDLPKEAERIKRCKGRVFALQDEPEVPRVWLPFDDAPGLAMARAFGDFCLKDYGVISVPEFTHRVLSERDKFIVLASDGVWDVLSNKEVVEIVSSAPTRSSAARIVVESAAREWKSKYPTSKMDDCAVVCLFLDGKMDSDSSDYEQQQEQQGGGGFSSASATRIILQSRRRHHSAGGNESDDDDDDDDDGQNITESACSLQRNFTVRSSQGNVAAADAEDLDWSGLDGVTRVNSLVQLPRFSQEFPKP